MAARFFILNIFTLINFNLHGQDLSDWSYNSKWQVRPSFGLNIPLTKLFKGTITDNLIDYPDGTSYYLQVITASYFFRKHWGVEFNYQGSSSYKTQRRGDRFSEILENGYQDKYFITSSGVFYDEQNIILGDIERGLFGIIYRKEFKRFLIYPKLAIGVTSFYTDWGSAFLKEKNSNTLLKVTYSPEKRPNDHFTTAGSLITGYKLSKRVFCNIEIMASYFKSDFTFTKITTNLNSGLNSVEISEYKKNIFTLNLGTGLIVVIR